MKAGKLLKILAGHVCIVCSIVLLAEQILDWYNPFMDFMGHSRFLVSAFCIAAGSLGICAAYPGKQRTQRRRKTEKQGEKNQGEKNQGEKNQGEKNQGEKPARSRRV